MIPSYSEVTKVVIHKVDNNVNDKDNSHHGNKAEQKSVIEEVKSEIQSDSEDSNYSHNSESKEKEENQNLEFLEFQAS